MSISAAQLVADVSVTGVASAVADLVRTGLAADTAGEAMKGLATGGLLLAGAAIIGIGTKAVQMAGNFQESMTQLVTGAGESKKNIDMVSQGILNMAVQTGESTDQLSQGMYMIESAGYHGAAGLSVLQAAAEGAKVGNASLADVANGVSTAMTDYAKSGLTATDATNILIATVANGKTHMADLANSMATILPTAAAVGVQFKDVSGAMATMTGEGTNAASAATYLRQLLMALESPAKAGAKALQAIGLTTGEVSADMKKSLPDTLQLIMKRLAETYTVGSPQYMAALKNIAGGSKQMQGILELTGDHLKVFSSNVGLIDGAARGAGNSIAGWADVQNDFNFKIAQAKEVIETLMIRLGTMLLPILTQVMGAVIPLVAAFSSWITSGSGLGSMFASLTGIVQGFFSGIGGKGGASPFAGLIADAKQFGTTVLSTVRPAFAEISSIVGGVFAQHMKTAQGIIADLSKWFSSTLLPAIHQAMPGFQALAGVLIGTVVPGLVKLWAIGQSVVDAVLPPLMHVMEAIIPVAIKLAGIIDAGLAAALKFLMPYILQAAQAIGQFAGEIATRIAPILINFFNQISAGLDAFLVIWKAVWPYLAPILKGVWDELMGVIKIAWSLISGIIKIGLDILSGNWGQAWTDVKDMFSGIWSGMVQDLQGAIGVITGIVSALVAGVVGFFQWLWDTLTGHSIIPDMIKDIFKWFTNLATTVITTVTNFVAGVIGWFVHMHELVTRWITTMVAAAIVKAEALRAEIIKKVEDLVNGVIGWFVNLHDQAIAKAQNVVDGITGVFKNLLSLATGWGHDLLQNFIDGAKGMLGNVGNTFSSIAGTIKSYIHFTKPDIGPLADFDTYAPDMMELFATGIESHIGRIKQAIGNVASAVQVGVQTPLSTVASPAPYQFPAMQQSPVSQLQQQLAQSQGTPVIFQIDGRQFGRVVMPSVINATRLATGVRSY